MSGLIAGRYHYVKEDEAEAILDLRDSASAYTGMTCASFLMFTIGGCFVIIFLSTGITSMSTSLAVLSGSVFLMLGACFMMFSRRGASKVVRFHVDKVAKRLRAYHEITTVKGNRNKPKEFKGWGNCALSLMCLGSISLYFTGIAFLLFPTSGYGIRLDFPALFPGFSCLSTALLLFAVGYHEWRESDKASRRNIGPSHAFCDCLFGEIERFEIVRESKLLSFPEQEVVQENSSALSLISTSGLRVQLLKDVTWGALRDNTTLPRVQAFLEDRILQHQTGHNST